MHAIRLLLSGIHTALCFVAIALGFLCSMAIGRQTWPLTSIVLSYVGGMLMGWLLTPAAVRAWIFPYFWFLIRLFVWVIPPWGDGYKLSLADSWHHFLGDSLEKMFTTIPFICSIAYSFGAYAVHKDKLTTSVFREDRGFITAKGND